MSNFFTIHDQLQLIQKHFPHLNEDKLLYPKPPYANDSCILIFQLPEIRIKFQWDRGNYSLLVGTNETPVDTSYESWWDIGIVIMYITKCQFLIARDYREGHLSFDDQLKRLSIVLQYYYPQIINIFAIENYENEKGGLFSTSEFIRKSLYPIDDFFQIIKKSKIYWKNLGIEE